MIEADSAARPVVSDDGRAIRLRLYREHSAAATVGLSPSWSVALTGRLLDAAGSKLALGET